MGCEYTQGEAEEMIELSPQLEIIKTEDGQGYWVCYGVERAFVSSMHLTQDKEAQLKQLLHSD